MSFHIYHQQQKNLHVKHYHLQQTIVLQAIYAVHHGGYHYYCYLFLLLLVFKLVSYLFVI